MKSPLYTDINEGRFSSKIEALESYARTHQMDILLLRLPKSDLPEEEYINEDCFILMSNDYQITMVNGGTEKEDFEFYCEDVQEIMSYLFSKYEYRSELGRFKKWITPLLSTAELSDLDNLDSFWSIRKLNKSRDRKNANLLLTLCSGSINDIKRVKADVPNTILDQVKQKIQAFDADQTRFIYQDIDYKKTIKVQGLSGTGKTELLLHKLKEIYQKPEKYRIFVTCHNKILADTLRDRIPEFFDFMKVTQQIEWNKRLWCTHAWGSNNDVNSGLYRYICDFYDIPFCSLRNVSSFAEACSLAVNAIKRRQPNGNSKYALDYIIVDESQDFKPEFLELCELVTSKRVYVAGDVFQSIFDKNISNRYEADYFLSRCYRTDNRTLMFAHALGFGLFEKKRLRWLSKNDWESCGYTCEVKNETNQLVLYREPTRRFLDIPDDYKCLLVKGFADETDLYMQLVKTILTIREENPSSSVNDFCIILLDDTSEIYFTANVLEAYISEHLSWKVNKAYESKKKIEDTLLISNRNNVKGLEYPFVICISNQLNFTYTYRNSIYTMLTRSFLQTILFLPREGSGVKHTIAAGYHEIMKYRRMTVSIPDANEKKEIETRFNSVTMRRPYMEIVRDALRTLDISNDSRGNIYKFAKNAPWQDLSETEIFNRINSLKDMM